jgi:hypothetical protein
MTMALPISDTVARLQKFEDGAMDHDEAIELFQELVDTGLVNELQGFYQRTAAALIAAGEITPAGSR